MICYAAAPALVAESILQNPAVMLFILIVAIALVLMNVIRLVRDLRKQEAKRVDDRLMGRPSRKGQKSEEEIRKSLIKKSAIAETGGGFVKAFGKIRPISGLQKVCFQADLDWNAAKLVVRLLIVAAGAGFVLLLLRFGIARAMIVGATILFGPIAYAYVMRKRRLYALVEQLPEVFDALVAALRAGQSLPSAIGVVSEQLPEPSRTEFGMVYYEQNLGVPIEDALGHMRDRLNQMDVNFFVTAVQIQKSSGGDLAEVLEKIGTIIRGRIRLFGQVKVLTAEGRMSGVVLLALPPVMLFVMMLINPPYANKLLLTDIGHKLLMLSFVMELLGWAMIRKIIAIDV